MRYICLFLLLAGSLRLHADTIVINDAATQYTIGIQNGSGPCLGSCDLSPSYNHYAAPFSFKISKITFNWATSGGNNCDGFGNYGAIISSTNDALGVVATSTNAAYLGCAGFSGGTSGTAELDFTGQIVPSSFYLDFASFDGGLQGGAGTNVSNVKIWQISQTGTITVTTNNIAATFTITDGGSNTFAAQGMSFSQSAPLGTYTIHYGEVVDLTTPNDQTASLETGGTITFNGTYVCSPPVGHAPFILPIIPDKPGFDSCPPGDTASCLTIDADGNCLMNSVRDDQNNQFQLWCMKPKPPNHFLSWWSLSYLPVGGSPKFAGKCPYEGGQDQGLIYFNAASPIDQPRCFIRSQWQVVDGGNFDDELLYVPWIGCPTCKPYSWVFDFDVASRMTKSTHINPDGIPIEVSTTDPLPEFNNLPPILDLSAIPAGGAPMGLVQSGDVNVDGRVDCADVKIVRGALGAKNGDFAYVPGADINRDGTVDLNDLATILQNFTVPNTTCPDSITFQALLNDIANGVQLGLIDDGVATSLSQKIRSAADDLAKGSNTSTTNVLNAFANEVQAQTGKHISPVAAIVLLNDTASLLSQISAQAGP